MDGIKPIFHTKFSGLVFTRPSLLFTLLRKPKNHNLRQREIQKESHISLLSSSLSLYLQCLSSVTETVPFSRSNYGLSSAPCVFLYLGFDNLFNSWLDLVPFRVSSLKGNNMNGSWFFDENFNGVPDDFFDDAIKYFDFPLEDVESNDLGEDWEAKFQQLVPPPSNVLAGLTAGLCGENSNDIVKVKKSSSILLDESSQPKQWPSAAEASSSRSICVNYDSSEAKYSHLFWTSSPVSVLESSSSSSSAENATVHQPKFAIPVKRPRSKRPRPQRRTFPFISTSYAPKQCHPLGSSESESESCPEEKMLNLAQKKQKKKNLMLLSCTVEMRKPSSQQPVEIRKCTHCEVTKTPQWREGPMGPKTLCNACGVRYRSGRLFPEYRPAASPTFVPSIHSNSHRKVIEMRKKTKPMTTMAAMEASLPTAPEYSF